MRIESGLRIYAVMPEVLVTGGDSLGGVGTIVEGEMESDGAVTADGIEN